MNDFPYVELFWIGIAMLAAGLILRYLFPDWDKYKDDVEKLTDNDQDHNSN